MNWILQAAYNQGALDTVVGGTPYSCLTCDENNPGICLEGISEMFYQSLLCPDNSTYTPTVSYNPLDGENGTYSNVSVFVTNTNSNNKDLKLNKCVTEGVTNRVIGGCVNTQCRCNEGYSVWNGTCLPSCGTDTNVYRDANGSCAKCTNGATSGGESGKKEHNMCSGS